MDVVTLAESGYAPDTEDAAWIPEVAANRWVILTKDKRIRRDSLELGAVLAARAFYFTLGGGSYKAEDMAAIILHHRPTIERLAEHREPPVVAQLNRHEAQHPPRHPLPFTRDSRSHISVWRKTGA